MNQYRVGDRVKVFAGFDEPDLVFQGHVIETRQGMYRVVLDVNTLPWWYGENWIAGPAFQTVFDL